MRTWPSSITAIALLACACVPVEESPVSGPENLRIKGPDAGDLEAVAPWRSDLALSLPDHTVLTTDGPQLLRIHPDGAAEDLGSEPGVVQAWARYNDGAVLAGERGLFTIDGFGLRRSPLDDLLDGGAIVALQQSGDTLWIGTETELYRWRGGSLSAVAPEGLPVASPLLAPALLDGERGVWVVSEHVLYGLTEGPAGLRAWEQGGHHPRAIASDASGSLWSAEGDSLFRRQPDGTWEQWIADSPVRRLHARPDRSDVWLTTDDGIARFDAVDFRGVEADLPGAIVDVDGLGRALVADRSVAWLSLDRPLLILGAPDGTLEEPVTLALFPTLPESLESLTVSLDGAPPTALTRPWTVELDPFELEEGPHALAFEATYLDREEPVTASAPFGIGTFEIPTWTDDIHPIHVAWCAECHDPGQSARLISSRDQWEADIDLILDNVVQQLMPLPPNDPLDAVTTQALRAWAAGGFPE